MGRIIDTIPDKKGIVRRVRVKTKSTILQRPVTKLCLLLEADSPEKVNEKIDSNSSTRPKDNINRDKDNVNEDETSTNEEELSCKNNTAKTRSGRQIKARERLDL